MVGEVPPAVRQHLDDPVDALRSVPIFRKHVLVEPFSSECAGESLCILAHFENVEIVLRQHRQENRQCISTFLLQDLPDLFEALKNGTGWDIAPGTTRHDQDLRIDWA